jgi:hypothetical protein
MALAQALHLRRKPEALPVLSITPHHFVPWLSPPPHIPLLVSRGSNIREPLIFPPEGPLIPGTIDVISSHLLVLIAL